MIPLKYLWHDILEVVPEARGFGDAHILARGDRMAIQGRHRDLVKVDEPELAHPRAEQHVRSMAANTLAGDEGGAQGRRWAGGMAGVRTHRIGKESVGLSSALITEGLAVHGAGVPGQLLACDCASRCAM